MKISRKKLTTQSQLNVLFLILLFTVKVVLYSFFGANGKKEWNLFITLLFFMGFGIQWIETKKGKIYKKDNFLFESMCMLTVLGTYIVLSLIYIVINRGSINTVTISGFWHILFPILAVYVIVNTLKFEEIEKTIKITFWICFIAYLVSVVIPILSNGMMFNISWKRSSSVFESTFFSYFAMGYSLYFSYFRKKWYTALSFVFIFLTFKRFMVIAALLALLLGKRLKGKSTSGERIKIYILSFLGIAAVYIAMVYGYLNELFYTIFKINFSGFTMSRALFFREILAKGFYSEGFSSSKLWAGDRWSMEMDLPMIFLEMGPVSVVVTVLCLFKTAQKYSYCIFMVIVCLIELLTSAWFDFPFFWILMYLTMYSVKYTENNQDDSKLDRYSKRRKVKCFGL